jgi:hypothetical protein
MAHGRNHDERRHEIPETRRGNTPDPDSIEAELTSGGRHGVMPKQHLVGAHTERYAGSNQEEDALALDDEQDEVDQDASEPTGPGADVAPTKKAEQRERLRHDLEQEAGRTTAGREGLVRADQNPEVTREQLDEIGREADRRTNDGDVPPSASRRN